VNRSRRSARRSVILVFGESDNDRKAIAALVRALCSGVFVRVLPRPLVLLKNARPDTAPHLADRLAAAARAEAVRHDVLCVLAHEDADAIEPAHEAVTRKIEKALAAAGTPGMVHAVVPAWEIEAWWFLWPDLVGSCYPSWQSPAVATPAGQIREAKERLAKAVRPARISKQDRVRFPDRRESDSIRIAEAVERSGRVDEPARGNCRPSIAFATASPSAVTDQVGRQRERMLPVLTYATPVAARDVIRPTGPRCSPP